MLPTRKDFPEGFTFGAATAAYQIEGHAFGGAGRTHWDDFAETPGNVVNAETGAVACDHYHRWEEDLDLLKAGNFDAYRFSASWARVMPEGRGPVNDDGLDFYDRLVDGMLARGIKPALTLYHWELPSALADLGGWRNRDIANWLADYAQVIWSRLGDRIWSVAPINEPWCVAWLSHFLGIHAPGQRDIRAAARAMHHVCLAHGTTVSALRAAGAGNIGAVFNFEHALPADTSPETAKATATYDAIYNRWFAGGVFRKSYPAEALEGLLPHMPTGWEKDFEVIGQPLDWCGVNYYTCKRVTHAPGPWPNTGDGIGTLPKTDMGWEIHPEGLHHFLMRLARDYTGELPLYITENGMAAPDRPLGNRIEDDDRIDYYLVHLREVLRAIADGAPVKGYFAWSLLDNYEWAMGYGKRFGLVRVDFDSLNRTPKASYEAFQKALAR